MKKYNDTYKLEDYLSYFSLNALIFLALSALFSLFSKDFEIINIFRYYILTAIIFLIDSIALFSLFYLFKYLFRNKMSSAKFESIISSLIIGLIFILDVVIFIRFFGMNSYFMDAFSYDSNSYSNACIIIGVTKISESTLYIIAKRLKGEKV